MESVWCKVAGEVIIISNTMHNNIIDWDNQNERTQHKQIILNLSSSLVLLPMAKGMFPYLSIIQLLYVHCVGVIEIEN